MRSLAPLLVVLVAVTSVGATSCAPEPLRATFTSRVVQHELCHFVGDRPEVCTRQEEAVDVRVRLVERADDSVWLYGIPRNGVSDRAILGSRDEDGGFQFIEEITSENDASACVLVERLEISITVDENAAVESIGTDPCVSLLGRETDITSTSEGCDEVNQPPLASSTVARRRWETPPECSP